MTQIIGLLYAGFLVYVGINYIEHLLSTGITSSSSLRLPMGYVYLAVPIGMALFAIFYLQSIIKTISNKSIESNSEVADAEIDNNALGGKI